MKPIKTAPGLSYARAFYLDATVVKFLAIGNQLVYILNASRDDGQTSQKQNWLPVLDAQGCDKCATLAIAERADEGR